MYLVSRMNDVPLQCGEQLEEKQRNGTRQVHYDHMIYHMTIHKVLSDKIFLLL
jgi:hypothetical protein